MGFLPVSFQLATLFRSRLRVRHRTDSWSQGNVPANETSTVQLLTQGRPHTVQYIDPKTWETAEQIGSSWRWTCRAGVSQFEDDHISVYCRQKYRQYRHQHSSCLWHVRSSMWCSYWTHITHVKPQVLIRNRWPRREIAAPPSERGKATAVSGNRPSHCDKWCMYDQQRWATELWLARTKMSGNSPSRSQSSSSYLFLRLPESLEAHWAGY